MIFSSTFTAMGCEAVVQCDRPDLLAVARLRIEALEAAWSLYLQESELSRLSLGEAVLISEPTRLLLKHMLAAWRLTGGSFNPVRRAGPSPDLDEVLAGVFSDEALLRVPSGVVLDPASLGKGLAADIVAAEMRSLGARDCAVSVGGDVAFHGRPRPLAVLSPDGSFLATVSTEHGGFATSASSCHGVAQVVDPKSGAPACSRFAQVTVASSTAAWSEVLATSSLVEGGFGLVDRLGVGALAVCVDTTVERSLSWRETSSISGTLDDEIRGAHVL